MDDLEKILNTNICFGLVAQGKIETIERLLLKGKNWSEIGKEIGWCPATAREHYERYLQSQKSDPNEACPILAKMVELLVEQLEKEERSWKRNELASLILQAEKKLLSKTKK